MRTTTRRPQDPFSISYIYIHIVHLYIVYYNVCACTYTHTRGTPIHTYVFYCGGRRWTCGACSSSVPRRWRQRHPTETFFTRSVDIHIIIYLYYYYTRTRHKNRVSCPFIIRGRACVEVCAYNNRKIVTISVAIYYFILWIRFVTYQNRYR